MYSLPTTIKIGDRELKIRNNGDFRMVLDCFSALQDTELTEDERLISSLIIFYDDIEEYNDITRLFSTEEELKEAISQMSLFFECGQKSIGANVHHKVIDWEKDSQMIFSAINNVARTEVRVLDYVHWWTFMGYFMSIGDSTLSTVVSIRHKIAKGKKLEKYEKEFKKDNPEYFTIDYRTTDAIDEEARIRALWEGGNLYG